MQSLCPLITRLESTTLSAAGPWKIPIGKENTPTPPASVIFKSLTTLALPTLINGVPTLLKSHWVLISVLLVPLPDKLSPGETAFSASVLVGPRSKTLAASASLSPATPLETAERRARPLDASVFTAEL